MCTINFQRTAYEIIPFYSVGCRLHITNVSISDVFITSVCDGTAVCKWKPTVEDIVLIEKKCLGINTARQGPWGGSYTIVFNIPAIVAPQYYAADDIPVLMNLPVSIDVIVSTGRHYSSVPYLPYLPSKLDECISSMYVTYTQTSI